MAMKLYRVTAKRSNRPYNVVEGMMVEFASKSRLTLGHTDDKIEIAQAFERKYGVDAKDFKRAINSNNFELEELG